MADNKKYYKLTRQNQTTFGGFKWRKNKWYKVSGEGDLCGDGWLHFYHSKDLAVLLNPAHASLANPILWEAECRGKSLDDKGLKIGWSEARLIKKVPLPKWTDNQKIAFGILCAKEVYKEKNWNKWADNWLSGKDRTASSARVIWAADTASATLAAGAVSAAEAASATLAADDVSAADAVSAAWATEAVWANGATGAVWVTEAAWVTEVASAAEAARVAKAAIAASVASVKKLNFEEIIRQAKKIK